jgi:hypothetical protein
MGLKTNYGFVKSNFALNMPSISNFHISINYKRLQFFLIEIILFRDRELDKFRNAHSQNFEMQAFNLCYLVSIFENAFGMLLMSSVTCGAGLQAS